MGLLSIPVRGISVSELILTGQLDNLVEYLDERGRRESVLKKNLQKKYNIIVDALRKRDSVIHAPPVTRSTGKPIVVEKDKQRPFQFYVNRSNA